MRRTCVLAFHSLLLLSSFSFATFFRRPNITTYMSSLLRFNSWQKIGFIALHFEIPERRWHSRRRPHGRSGYTKGRCRQAKRNAEGSRCSPHRLAWRRTAMTSIQPLTVIVLALGGGLATILCSHHILRTIVHQNSEGWRCLETYHCVERCFLYIQFGRKLLSKDISAPW